MRSWNIALQTSPAEFYPEFGALPAVVRVHGQPPTWDAAGFTRTLELSDGGSVVETIAVSDPGVSFVYDLHDFRRLFGWLVSGARAEWTFASEGATTRIRWSYAFHPRPGRGLVVDAIVLLLWAPYMRRVLPTIVAAIERR